jgi:hypothetical protein
MVEDPQWELAILGTVHSFYQRLLEECLCESLLVPAGLTPDEMTQPPADLPAAVERTRRWLRLLDLSVSPSMLRRALTADGDPEVAEALLRYFARKDRVGHDDRDKADFIVTFLYRNPRVPGQWERHGFGLDGSVPLPPFEIALMEILTDAEPLPLSENAALLLCELDALREQSERLGDFGELVDLAVVQRGRHLKSLLNEFFFHPAALASAATYNVTLDRKFKGLFHSTAGQIRTFAQDLQREGGNPFSRLDGEITVRDVAQLQEEDVLQAEYGVSQDRFRSVLRVRKALEEKMSQPLARAAAASADGATAAAPAMPAPILATTAAAQTSAHTQAASIRSGMHLVYDPAREEDRLNNVGDAVARFVRTADPQLREVVPMRSFNLVLTPAEADAFSSDFTAEQGIYGETSRMLVRMVSVLTRMGAEYEELKQKQNSTTLGGPHADALRSLVTIARHTADRAEEVFLHAEEQGLEQGAASLLESLDRLRGRADFVSEVLDGWRPLKAHESPQ